MFTAQGAQLPLRTKSAAKLQKKIRIRKFLEKKIYKVIFYRF